MLWPGLVLSSIQALRREGFVPVRDAQQPGLFLLNNKPSKHEIVQGVVASPWWVEVTGQMSPRTATGLFNMAERD